MPFVLAGLSGLLLALCFPGTSLGLLSLIAFTPLFVALHRPGAPAVRIARPRRAFALGYVMGAVFFLVLLHWIPRLPRENVTIPYAMIPALFLMAAYLALYPALAAWTAAVLGRRGVPVGLSFPLAWTLLEVVKGTGTFGFPWGSTGYALAPYPQLIQFASWTGIWGVTLWVVLVNGLVHLLLHTWARGPRLLVAASLLGLLVLPYVQGRMALSHREVGPGVRVGLLQPNVGKDKWKLAVRDSVITALLDHTRDLAEADPAHPPDLLVWPETAIPARLPREPRILRRVQALVDSTGIPLLAGFPDGVPEGEGWRFHNSAALVLPGEGIVARYDKRHLVPFSEHFPLPILNRFDFGQSNFTPGRGAVIFDRAGPPFGVLICFESIFPGLARELTRGGARYLVNITNDQWFGDSPAPYQHFDMNVLRCIENGVGMARAANTGISAVIDPHGVVIRETPTFIATRLVETVELGTGLTLYARWGDWILGVAGAALLALAVRAWRRGGTS